MRDMAGGSYLSALRRTFMAELLSMNHLMAGMVPTVMALKARIATGADPMTPSFWFVMSMGLLVGFIVAYPMNWWLMANHLKHGMMTIRPAGAAAGANDHGTSAGEDDAPPATRRMSHGRRRGAVATGPGDGAAFVPGTRGRRSDRLPVDRQLKTPLGHSGWHAAPQVERRHRQ